MAEQRNAIARRIDRLRDQWNEFATNPDARLLRWMVRDDEQRVFEAFIQSEQDDGAGEIPDLFLTFTEPFRDVVSYGEALRAFLVAQYDETRPELRESGIDDGWSPPSSSGRHTLTAFIEACASLRDHYDEITDRVALILLPTSIASASEWQRWLGALAERLPEPVRAAVLDTADLPAFDALAEAQPQRVVTVVADLDMDGALLELSRTGNVATPDGQFRVQFTALAQALGKSDLEAAGTRAEAAVKIAATNGWTHLVAAVHMAMAGGLLSAAKYPEAVARYTDAGRAAAELEGKGDEVGGKLLLQASLGRAAVFFAAQDFVKAAEAYAVAALLAVKAHDPLMLMESWRMSAYCHEQNGDRGQSWECGLRSLDAAESLPLDNRKQSTLPFAGEGLLRVVPPGSEAAMQVEQRMEALLGTTDWRSLVAAAVARG